MKTALRYTMPLGLVLLLALGACSSSTYTPGKVYPRHLVHVDFPRSEIYGNIEDSVRIPAIVGTARYPEERASSPLIFWLDYGDGCKEIWYEHRDGYRDFYHNYPKPGKYTVRIDGYIGGVWQDGDSVAVTIQEYHLPTRIKNMTVTIVGTEIPVLNRWKQEGVKDSFYLSTRINLIVASKPCDIFKHQKSLFQLEGGPMFGLYDACYTNDHYLNKLTGTVSFENHGATLSLWFCAYEHVDFVGASRERSMVFEIDSIPLISSFKPSTRYAMYGLKLTPEELSRHVQYSYPGSYSEPDEISALRKKLKLSAYSDVTVTVEFTQ